MAESNTLSYEPAGASLSGVGIGTIALQLLGVYFIFVALTMLPLFASYMGTSRNVGIYQIAMFGAEFAIHGAAGFAIIRWAPRLSIWLFHESPNGLIAGPITSSIGRAIQAIAFSVVGVYLMANAVASMAGEAMALFHWTALVTQAFIERDMLTQITSFFVGLALFLGSNQLSRLWHRLRGTAAPLASMHSGERMQRVNALKQVGDQAAAPSIHSGDDHA